MLFSYFWLMVPKWSSAVTHRENEMRRYWIPPPPFIIKFPKKEKKGDMDPRKTSFSLLHFLKQFRNGVK